MPRARRPAGRRAVTRSVARALATAPAPTPPAPAVDGGIACASAAPAPVGATPGHAPPAPPPSGGGGGGGGGGGADLLTKNRMTVLRLEQSGALSPGVLTISPAGELLLADLAAAEPDAGTMATLYPNMAPSPDNVQIPSWLRDCLVKELNVHGSGPPAVCRAFYDHLREAQESLGHNHGVRSAESLLAYASISLRYKVEEIRNFVDMKYVSRENYEEEVAVVIKNIKQLVGYQGEEMKAEIRMLVDIADMGGTMKDALTAPLQGLIIGPYTKLIGKLELVSKALRMELGRMDEEAEKTRKETAMRTPDSGIGGCWS